MRLLGVVLMVVLLSGCQRLDPLNNAPKGDVKHSSKPVVQQRGKPHYQQTDKDGAPPGPFPNFFKAVKPKDEPLSHYGNPGAYQVKGKHYEVMTSATGYRTRGLASWYGTKFHAKRTSSGEPYDMYALTAAHKTLPLPTYVKIKNLNNGRVAIVKVNDRGPFHSDRIIDLSYAAAVKLGLFPKGTAMVEIEALSVRTQGKSHQAQYYLQAGAFQSSTLATALRVKLSKLTPSTVFIERYHGRYLVKVGPFATRKMTDQLNHALQRQGVKGAFSLLQ
jgi:rare lipoprotein A